MVTECAVGFLTNLRQKRTILGMSETVSCTQLILHRDLRLGPGGGGVLPYMGLIGMCRCEGYGFQAVTLGQGV